jgi:hypothetical protein
VTHQVLGFVRHFGHGRQEGVFNVDDFLEHCDVVVGVKGAAARQHFVGQHAERPPVDGAVVARARDLLGSEVGGRAAERVGFARAQPLGEGEIRNLEIALISK